MTQVFTHLSRSGYVGGPINIPPADLGSFFVWACNNRSLLLNEEIDAVEKILAARSRFAAKREAMADFRRRLRACNT